MNKNANPDTDALETLLEFADELRGAVTDLLELPTSDDDDNPTSPAEELLANGRAVALAIQELGARTEIVAASLVLGTERLAVALEELRDVVEDLSGEEGS